MEESLKTASIIQMAATGAAATRLSLTGSLSSEEQALIVYIESTCILYGI